MKFITALFAVLLLSVSAFAVGGAAPTRVAVDGITEFGGLDTTISSGLKYDTLVNTDSLTLITNHVFSKYWEYVLVIGPCTGSSSGSSVMQIYVDALDGSGNILTRTMVDSIVGATSTSGAMVLPIYTKSLGMKYRIKILNVTGAENILNRIFIFKRRPVVLNKNWF